MSDRPRCRKTKANGKPCQNKAAAGSAYCGVHGGARRKTGAPVKLTEQRLTTITEAVEQGATYEVAAQAAGVHADTFRRWRQQGADDAEAGRQSDFRELYAALDDARARGELALIRSIRADSDWRAKAWLLERRAPERWARRDKIDVEVSERAKPREVAPVQETREQILSILADATKAPAAN